MPCTYILDDSIKSPTLILTADHSTLLFLPVFYTIKNFFFLLWVNLYMITETYLHDPPPFNSSFFMTPPFSAVSKSCNPPSVSTPPPPLLISDKSLSGKQKIRQFWITQKFLYTCASNCTLVFLMSSRNSMRTWVHFSAMIFNVTARLYVDRRTSLIRFNDRLPPTSTRKSLQSFTFFCY